MSIPLKRPVPRRAALPMATVVRTLDAIHLASAAAAGAARPRAGVCHPRSADMPEYWWPPHHQEKLTGADRKEIIKRTRIAIDGWCHQLRWSVRLRRWSVTRPFELPTPPARPAIVVDPSLATRGRGSDP